MAITTSKSGAETNGSAVQSGASGFSGQAGKKTMDTGESVKPAVESKGKSAGFQADAGKFEDLVASARKIVNGKAKRKPGDEEENGNAAVDDVNDQADAATTQAEYSDDRMVLALADTATPEAAPAAGTAASSTGAAAGGEAAGGTALGGGSAASGTAVAAGVSSQVMLGAALAVGIAASGTSGGGGGGSSVAAATGFTLSGTIALGKINDATGLVVEAFKADGTKLAGTGTVNADGTFSIAVTENYSGPVLVRLKDTNAGTNYNDEGTGLAKDLATDLRAVVNVSGNGTITVAITPLTELAVRELVGDSGGDGGTAATTLGASVTTTQVTTANDNVKTAFGLTSDITTTVPVTVDDATAFNAGTAAQKAYGQVLAAIAGAEVDQGLSTGAVLTGLSQDLVGSTLSVSAVDDLLAGAAVADGIGTNVTGTAAALDTVIGSNISNIQLSADTGNASDFITATTGQTITATLDVALSSTKLWGSVDGGTTWTDISSFVTTTSLNWTGVTLGSGDGFIKFAVTADTVTTFTGSTSSVVGGKIAAQAYAVDTTNPAFSSATSASFAENGTGFAYDATATDAHLPTYTLGGADVALFNIDASSGVVTFKTTPNFEAPADTGTDNTFDITVTATDGAGNATTQAVAIAVTNVNEAPTISSGATASFAENATGAAYTTTATDPDASTTLTYTLGGADVALFNIDSGTGAITFKAAPNFEAPADAGGNNVYDVTVTATDNGTGSLSATQAVAITVTNVNETPTLTSAATASVVENTPTSTAAYTAMATDPDAGTTLTYALGGTDALLFDINASTGAVTFKASPNFEAPTDAGGNKVYDVTVTASDGTNTTSAQAVAITVTNANEAPTSTSVTPTTVAVNQAYSFDVSSNFSDVDAGNAFAYSATGLPTGLTINASSGIISGTATATGTSSVTVTATDSGGLTTSQSFNLAVVSAPVISSIASSAALAESGDALTFSATFTEAVSVVTTGGTPTLTLDVGGQTLTATYSGGTGTSTLTFTATTGMGDSAAVTISAINLNGGTIIGNVTSQPLVTTAVGQLVAAFAIDNSAPAFTSGTTASYAENATSAAYTSEVTDVTTLTYTLGGADAALFDINASTGAVTFKVAPNFEVPVDAGADNGYAIDVMATDAMGDVATQSVVITVTNVNETPTITSGATASFAENATGTVHTVTATDPDAGTTLTYALGGTDAALFDISASTGAVTFKAAPNFEAPADAGGDNVYNVTVTASDGTNTTSAQAVAITVTNVNEMPTLTSAATASVVENTPTSTAAYTATATDPDAGTTLTYVLGGTDAALFDINASTGAVTFKASPNFEAPTDAGGNKVYDVTVTASDGTNTTSAQAVAITVTNANEAPTSSPATSTDTIAVNQALNDNMADLFSDVDASDTLTFTSTTLPTGINLAANGDITGTPTATGTYEITFTATDSGGLTATHTATVNVVSAPAITNTATLDGLANLDVRSDLVLTFSDTIVLGSGQIRIMDDEGVSGWTLTNTTTAESKQDTTDNDVVITLASGAVTGLTVGGVDKSAEMAGSVTVNGNKLVISPAGSDSASSTDWDFDWDFGADYHVEMDAGVVTANGIGNVAISNSTTLNFTTVTPVGNATGAASQAMAADGTLTAGYTWHHGHVQDATADGLAMNFGTGSHGLVLQSETGADNRKTTIGGKVLLSGLGTDDVIYMDNMGDMSMLTTDGQKGANYTGSGNTNARLLDNADGGTQLQTVFADYASTGFTAITSLGGGDLMLENSTHFNANLVIFG